MQPSNAASRDGQPQFILKTPLALGATWKTSAGRYEITGLDALAAVPAGVFEDCIEVTFWSRNGQAKAVTLYVPGVGMVQRDESFTILGGLGGEGWSAPGQGQPMADRMAREAGSRRRLSLRFVKCEQTSPLSHFPLKKGD